MPHFLGMLGRDDDRILSSYDGIAATTVLPDWSCKANINMSLGA